MVNTEAFIKRLEKLLDYYGLSASVFADKIGVQRSSISHLLTGRNKPSLEFVMKVITTFPEVNLYWLLNGKGSFPSPGNESQATSKSPRADHVAISKKAHREIDKIIIFYSDGSFETYGQK